MSITFQASIFDDLTADPELNPLAGFVSRIELDDGAWLTSVRAG